MQDTSADVYTHSPTQGALKETSILVLIGSVWGFIYRNNLKLRSSQRQTSHCPRFFRKFRVLTVDGDDLECERRTSASVLVIWFVSQRGARSCETVSWEPITPSELRIWRWLASARGVATLTDHATARPLHADPLESGIHTSTSCSAVWSLHVDKSALMCMSGTRHFSLSHTLSFLLKHFHGPYFIRTYEP